MTSSTFPAEAGAFFPGLVTTRLVATCEFYFEHFDFRLVGAEDDTMLLARADGTRLGLLRAGNLDQPAALQGATRGCGMWLNLEVDDPDALFARLHAAGVEVVAPPEFTLSATRRFIVRDPNGVLVYVTDRNDRHCRVDARVPARVAGFPLVETGAGTRPTTCQFQRSG